MVNYGNGKIYKIEPIVNHDWKDIYVGSTTKWLSQRMDTHRSEYKRFRVGKCKLVRVYQIFDKYGIENCNIILLENVNCNTKDELLARESYYIKNFDCVNRNIPGRSTYQYYEDNKEKYKQYYQDNKIKKLAYQNAYNKEKRKKLNI